MSFGRNLQYLRRLCGNMTQEALAERLNVSRQTVSKWEMDAALPEMSKAMELCKDKLAEIDGIQEYNQQKMIKAFQFHHLF